MIKKKVEATTATCASRPVIKNGFLHELVKNRTLFLMLLPAFILVVVFSYIPKFGIIVAFKEYDFSKGIIGSPWVGLKNFKYMFESGKMGTLVGNTLYYNIVGLILGNIVQIFFALLIAEMSGKYLKRTMQTMMLLPHFLSWVIVGGFVYNLLNYDYGIINNLLTTIGFSKFDAYNSPESWRFLFPLLHLWKTTGYSSIYYLTTIIGISPELYEAAYIDGASMWQRIRYITIPLIIPTAIILLLLSLGGILIGNFDMFYQIVGTNTVLYKATDVLDTYVFRALMDDNDFGFSSAAGFLQQVVGFVLVVTVNTLVKRYDADYALF